ncbi:MAG: hypothetical protein HY781_03540 [Chloroflexi bacterium]|nr:hypothetical protein [Chloroflexota bacterium]
MTPGIFNILLLTGRPASGKSEVIDFLIRTSPAERRARFHVGKLDVLDDFPMLWTWFEEDILLSQKFGLPRLHSDEQGYFKYPQLWHLLMERLCLDYQKILRDKPGYHTRSTALIEFSRGSEHGGYQKAFAHLSEEVLQRASILYVNVSFTESLRKNRRRFNPDRPDSILEHGLSNAKMERLYRDDDWAELAPGESGFLSLSGYKVPYAVFENEDDVTTGKPDLLSARLETALSTLWQLRQQP